LQNFFEIESRIRGKIGNDKNVHPSLRNLF